MSRFLAMDVSNLSIGHYHRTTDLSEDTSVWSITSEDRRNDRKVFERMDVSIFDEITNYLINIENLI